MRLRLKMRRGLGVRLRFGYGRIGKDEVVLVGNVGEFGTRSTNDGANGLNGFS